MRTKVMAKAMTLLLAASVFPAQANFHLMAVVEIFPGTAAAPDAQYVVLQMYASGENFVSGRAITVYDGSGTLVGAFTFPGHVSNGADQAKILIATPQAVSFFGLAADLTMTPALLAAGGKVCFASNVDCVAWGGYAGSAFGVGTPFNATNGLQFGRAAVRRLDIAGSATVLDIRDDTNNSANDFVFGLPAPRNNAGVLGTIPAATCGNGVIQGLEQCDDNNLVNGDGCSSTCSLGAVTSRRVSDDYDGDGKSDLFWRNSSTGANVIWKSANASTSQAVTTVTSQTWQVQGVGDFDGDGKSDLFWRNSSTGANVIWKSGNAATSQSLTGVTSQTWQVRGVGDFDGDGKSDLFWRNSSTGANVIWKSGNAATSYSVTTVTSQTWQVQGVGDFDGDGKSDLFWRNSSTGANVIWKSGNAATSQSLTGVTSQTWQVRGVGDFDGDGKSDLFWRNSSTGANVIWKSGNAATSYSVTTVTSQTWQVQGVGDFDGDGKSDLFWRNSSTGANVIWKSGNAATSYSVTTVTSQTWQVRRVGDFDGDGKSDLFWRNSSTGANVIWKSGNAATSQTLTTVISQSWQVMP